MPDLHERNQFLNFTISWKSINTEKTVAKNRKASILNIRNKITGGFYIYHKYKIGCKMKKKIKHGFLTLTGMSSYTISICTMNQIPALVEMSAQSNLIRTNARNLSEHSGPWLSPQGHTATYLHKRLLVRSGTIENLNVQGHPPASHCKVCCPKRSTSVF